MNNKIKVFVKDGIAILEADGVKTELGRADNKEGLLQKLKEHKVSNSLKYLRWLEANVDEASLDILTNPNLFDRITKTELSKYIVGEEAAIKTIFLCSSGRLVGNNKPASFNLMVNGDSSIGKDCVVSNTLRIWSPEIYIKRTKITPEVFTYWHTAENEPDWDWSGKVFYCEDISSAVLNASTFKVLAGSGSEATVVSKQQIVNCTLKGKPVVIITTASAEAQKELLRRFPILNLDESAEQTGAIIEKDLKAGEEGIIQNAEYDSTLTTALTKLARVEVKVPYATALKPHLSNEHLIMRTQAGRIVDLIRASAALHQYQREVDDDDFVIADGRDYEIAREVLIKITSNVQMIPLTSDQKKILEAVKGLEVGDDNHTISKIAVKVNSISERTVRRHLDRLASYGFLSKSSIKTEKDSPYRGQNPYTYEYVGMRSMRLPTWNELEPFVKQNPVNPDNPDTLTILTTCQPDRSDKVDKPDKVEACQEVSA